jgi:3-deoxy-D-manno-octulosonate 8-phosphate phosphatase (KDO 8-P phosphatase)
MVSSTLSTIKGGTASPYIVVLDGTADVVRALLFDSEARRVEGYSAQLPKRADAAVDCLDEMHRLVHADGFRVGAVMGYAESLVTPEDRAAWPGFAGAAWFPALPEGAGDAIGCGGYDRIVLVADAGTIATIVDAPRDGFSCAQIDDKRWLLSGTVPEAVGAFAALKKEVRGSVEAFLESAPADDPRVARLALVARRFREVYEVVSKAAGKRAGVTGCGGSLLKSPSWTEMIAKALGEPLTLSTEPEPACRGAALWALERIGSIGNMEAPPASTAAAATFEPRLMNAELLERASRIKMLLMDVDGVLTNAKLYNVPGPDGKMWETKGFDAQDGIALQWMSWYGIETGVISGRVSPAVEERAKQVKMTHVYQGHIEKIPILEQICEKSGIKADTIAYIGDDLTDVVVMRRVLLGIAPSNARPEVKKAAHMVTSAAGGSGAVREVCELLLQAQGKWPEILKKYEIE